VGKDCKGNGCGPAALAWIIPDLWFREACNCHDTDYKQGGSKSYRHASDIAFLGKMLNAVRDKGRFTEIVGTPLAFIYYLAVRIAGGIYYKGRWK